MRPVAERAARSRASWVLTRAVVRAARSLGLTQKALAATLGISEASASRLNRGGLIEAGTKKAELAALLVRLYRSLDSLLGGDQAKARAWMHAHNLHLGGTPAEMIQTVVGLIRVAEYLDAFRGKS